MFHDDKYVKQAKGRRDHHTEVTGNNRCGMIPDERPPALRGHARPSTAVHAPGHVFPHGTRRYPQAELEQEFIGNTFLTPGRILMSHTTDKGLQVRWEQRTSRGGLPAPEEPESLAMPADKGVRLHNGQGCTPVEPACEPDQGETGSIGGTARRDVALLVEG
jgi:hypothetical protein